MVFGNDLNNQNQLVPGHLVFDFKVLKQLKQNVVNNWAQGPFTTVSNVALVSIFTSGCSHRNLIPCLSKEHDCGPIHLWALEHNAVLCEGLPPASPPPHPESRYLPFFAHMYTWSSALTSLKGSSTQWLAVKLCGLVVCRTRRPGTRLMPLGMWQKWQWHERPVPAIVAYPSQLPSTRWGVVAHICSPSYERGWGGRNTHLSNASFPIHHS